MTANTEVRKLLREFLDLTKCRAVGHQCGGSNDSACMRFDDGLIYARRKSEIVRINDETSHSASLAEGTPWIDALWLVRSSLYSAGYTEEAVNIPAIRQLKTEVGRNHLEMPLLR